MAEPDAEPNPAQIGRYEVVRKIGSGGVGVVYQAHDPSLSRDVAVKLLRADRFPKKNVQRAHERLRSEARTMAKLAHPNVVTVFDVGSHEDGVYIAMELIDGPSIREWSRSTARHWREVLGTYFRAGLGLAAAHSAGIVHRDFKPANVLVGSDGRARVTDFGLASAGPAQGDGAWVAPDDTDLYETADGSGMVPEDLASLTVGTRTTSLGELGAASSSGLRPAGDLAGPTSVEGARAAETFTAGLRLDATSDSLLGEYAATSQVTLVTKSGFVAGTPAYMAPELFLGRGADEGSDQFALAVALWEGLYGERPFAGDTAAELVDAVVAGRIRRPETTRVPVWVEKIVRRGLARDPTQRHPSVRSMLASFAFLAKVMWD